MSQNLAKTGAELPALMTAGRWKSSTMPARYTGHQAADRGAVARHYQKQDDQKQTEPDGACNPRSYEGKTSLTAKTNQKTRRVSQKSKAPALWSSDPLSSCSVESPMTPGIPALPGKCSPPSLSGHQFAREYLQVPDI